LDRDQTKLAITRQRKDCQKLCEQRGWEPVEYVDNSVSATNGKVRPAYHRMLADIADGNVSAVVVWDLDRLHRQPRELEDFIDLADEHRLALATVTGDCDLATDNGRLYARIKGAVGKSETERKAARQRAAARQKAERGLPQWRKAFGYMEGPNGPEPDPQTAPLVKQAYAALLAGSSLNDIGRLFHDAGAYGLNGKPWTASTVSLFLRAPRNAGLRAYNGEVVGKGAWVPLVDESTWRAAQAVLNADGRAPGRKSVRQHLLTGVMKCGKCGHHLAGQWVMQKTGGEPGRPKAGETKQPSGQVAHSITYCCRRCRGCSIRAEHVEPLVYEAVSQRLASPDAVDLLRAEAHDTTEAERMRTEANTLLTRLDEIADERADGLLTGKQAQRATERIQTKLDAIERRQQDAERLRVFDGLPLGTPQAKKAVGKLSPDRLRAVMDLLMTVTVLPVGKGHKVFNPDRVLIDPKR
jgi:DNA invertase Pin-like site-specific DNA recombinase